MKREKAQRSVLTVYNGRAWVNVRERTPPFRGTFATEEAAVAVGRAHAADARTVHVIHDEAGEVVETHSYEELARVNPGAGFVVPDVSDPSQKI